MTPKLTESPKFREQARGKQRKADSGIYLRTYAVIESLDRAEVRSWKEKVFGQGQEMERATKRRSRPVLAVPPPPSEPAANVANQPDSVRPAQEAASVGVSLPKSPVLARRTLEVPTPELSLVRINYQPIVNHPAEPTEPVQSIRKVSWVWLALLAVVTACVTFAIIRLAWGSLAADPAQHPRHATTYLTSRAGSEVKLKKS